MTKLSVCVCVIRKFNFNNSDQDFEIGICYRDELVLLNLLVSERFARACCASADCCFLFKSSTGGWSLNRRDLKLHQAIGKGEFGGKYLQIHIWDFGLNLHC